MVGFLELQLVASEGGHSGGGPWRIRTREGDNKCTLRLTKLFSDEMCESLLWIHPGASTDFLETDDFELASVCHDLVPEKVDDDAKVRSHPVCCFSSMTNEQFALVKWKCIGAVDAIEPCRRWVSAWEVPLSWLLTEFPPFSCFFRRFQVPIFRFIVTIAEKSGVQIWKRFWRCWCFEKRSVVPLDM